MQCYKIEQSRTCVTLTTKGELPFTLLWRVSWKDLGFHRQLIVLAQVSLMVHDAEQRKASKIKAEDLAGKEDDIP